MREYFQEEICFIYKHFPVVRMNSFALLAAQVLEACALQQKYLQAHDLILDCQEFLEYELGGNHKSSKKNHSISVQQLNIDLKSEVIRGKIDNDIKTGTQSGMKNTPLFYQWLKI